MALGDQAGEASGKISGTRTKALIKQIPRIPYHPSTSLLTSRPPPHHPLPYQARLRADTPRHGQNEDRERLTLDIKAMQLLGRNLKKSLSFAYR